MGENGTLYARAYDTPAPVYKPAPPVDVLHAIHREIAHQNKLMYFVVFNTFISMTLYAILLGTLYVRTDTLQEDLEIGNVILSKSQAILAQIQQAQLVEQIISTLATSLPRIQTMLLVARDVLIDWANSNSTTALLALVQNAQVIISDFNTYSDALQNFISVHHHQQQQQQH